MITALIVIGGLLAYFAIGAGVARLIHVKGWDGLAADGLEPTLAGYVILGWPVAALSLGMVRLATWVTRD